jgi:hypothetical protein
VLRRAISAVALVALASSPAVGRTRLFCRYTGVEITDCAEQARADSVVEIAGCCDRQVTRPLGVVVTGGDHEFAPPVLHLVPAVAVADPPGRVSAARRRCASPTGPPLYVTARALLI